MSFYGIRPPIPLAPGAVTPQPTRDPRARIEQQRGALVPTTRPVPNQTIAGQPAGGALPLHAPTGTDPELWKVLSEDERAYFAKLGAMGPLTYGRVLTQQPQAPSVRGGRLDVKV